MSTAPRVIVIDDDLLHIDIASRAIRDILHFNLIGTYARAAPFLLWAETQGHAWMTATGKPAADLVLLDIHLPRMDGFSLLEKMRTLACFKQTSVIAWTAHVLAPEQERYRDLGFQGFLGKPVNMNVFPDQLMRIMAGEEVWEV